MNIELQKFIVAFLAPSLLMFMFFFEAYKMKKKAGRLDPNKSFLQNLWDSVLP